ncbi:unnamed protein product [Orchesella dallaii]|uniref:Uncharacterized protein n=1 Tax=Orchesella dallaii TaxID=48710 RepID=A0ABP1Q545_9HEXA
MENEYMTLKPNSDYPHIAEVIPDDFQDFALPYTKVHRDGSRELHILTERRRRKHKKTLIKGGYGCCIWCGQLMCLCCLLAMKRNTLRFIGLILVIICLLLILLSLVQELIQLLA